MPVPKMTGPAPKREEERIRRNKPEFPVEHLEIEGEVEVPDIGFDNVHRLVRDLYDSAKRSGQSKYYEPTDWAFLRANLYILNEQMNSGKWNANMVATVFAALGDLLFSEGMRRRARLEVDRVPVGTKTSGENVVSFKDAMMAKLNA